mgnify:FL=1
MIKKLQKRLTLLFICSVMSIFTVVFCLFIHESIQSKKENEMYFFTRMITYLVFQLENTDDAAGDLTLTGQTYDFTLLLKNNQNAFIPVNTNHSNTDTNTLITLFEQELNKTSTDLLDNTHSSQSGIFSFSTPDKHSYYGIQATAITKNMDILDFYAIKESTSSFTFLKEHLPFYLIVWLLVFIANLFLTRFLISKAIKPTEQTLRSQKEFIASASHELKAPLAVILASAECIGNDTTLSLESKQHTEVIDSECLRMSKLVQDLLLLSSVDANTWTLNKTNIDVDTLLINTYEKYEPICRQKGIQFKLNTSDELFPVLNADIDRLNQILSIFIDNAINYSLPKSEVSLDATVLKNTLVFSIKDHGTGIADKDKPFIFDRFFCADKSRTQKEHYGLGLCIAKELVEMHKGKIELSDTLGGRCTFKIFLPL